MPDMSCENQQERSSSIIPLNGKTMKTETEEEIRKQGKRIVFMCHVNWKGCPFRTVVFDGTGFG